MSKEIQNALNTAALKMASDLLAAVEEGNGSVGRIIKIGDCTVKLSGIVEGSRVVRAAKPKASKKTGSKKAADKDAE